MCIQFTVILPVKKMHSLGNPSIAQAAVGGCKEVSRFVCKVPALLSVQAIHPVGVCCGTAVFLRKSLPSPCKPQRVCVLERHPRVCWSQHYYF